MTSGVTSGPSFATGSLGTFSNPSKYDLQTVIVKKVHDGRRRSRSQAERIADEHAHRAIYTSRETSTSYRFRQRPPSDFVEGTFRTRGIGNGVSLVFGKLKRGMRVHRKSDRRRNPDGEEFEGGILPQDIVHFQSCLPDPGPCAWLGETLQVTWVEVLGRFKYETREWDSAGNWMMLWSPRLSAVICVPCKDLTAAQSGDDKAEEIVRRWSKREPRKSATCTIPQAELVELGKAKSIVYRSDKWQEGTDQDYIHEFQEGVRCFADNADSPGIFVICGGRLTVTERGLIY